MRIGIVLTAIEGLRLEQAVGLPFPRGILGGCGWWTHDKGATAYTTAGGIDKYSVGTHNHQRVSQRNSRHTSHT